MIMYSLGWTRIPYRRVLGIVPRISSYSFATDIKNTLQGNGRGLVLGFYESANGYELTKSASLFNEKCDGNLKRLLEFSGNKLKKGDSMMFYDLHKEYPAVSIVCLGPQSPNEDLECVDVKKESVRQAAAVGAKSLKKAGAAEIEIENFSDSEAAAEGSVLAMHDFDRYKTEKSLQPTVTPHMSSSSYVDIDWKYGTTVATAQNFARELMEMPCNYLTPATFVEIVCDKLSSVADKMQFIGRPYSWIKGMKMGAFVSVAKGSVEEPYLLEVKYSGDPKNQSCIALVGKGVTFDTGGISIKPAAKMGLMKGDMGGAAVVCATMLAIASLELPINVVALTPLCENMPSGSSYKPGDVVTAMNGKTIEIEDTDAEGRLILADALCYAHNFNPSEIIDVATLTGAIVVALGSGAAGVFTNSDALWSDLEQASRVTGDRLWRMPLFHQYKEQLISRVADINHTGQRERSASSCTAACFLKEFINVDKWAHFDIAGVMQAQGEISYLDNGMSGRPTRTLIQYLKRKCQKNH